MLRSILTAFAVILTTTVPAGAAPDDSCGIPPETERCESWSARVPAANGARFNEVLVSSDGSRIFAAGQSGTQFLASAYTPAGAELWSRMPGAGYAQGAVLTPDDSTLVIAGNGGGDFVVTALHAGDGSTRWASTFDEGYGLGDTLNAVAMSPDGARVYVTGYSDTPSVQYDASTVAFDTATGTQLWSATYDGPARFWDMPTAIDAASVPIGNGTRELVFITSRSNVQSAANQHTDAVTVAYDGVTGEQVWTNYFNGPSGDREYPYALEASSDGTRVYVAAESVAPGVGFDFATIALDAATGEQAWSALLHGGEGDDRPLSIAVSPDGSRIFTTGFTPNPGPISFVDRSATTVAYDAAGSQLWVAKSTTLGGEAAGDVEVAPDGRTVYVAGLTVGQAIGVGVSNPLAGTTQYLHVNGFLTISLDADTGAQRWVARFRDPGTARAIAIDPAGGATYVAGGGSDAVLLSYDTATT